MDFAALLGIAVGLSMDAFAVSIAQGAPCKNFSCKLALKLAFSFGFFQALMPLIGWLIGKAGESLISSIDHWIALILLVYLGIHMILEGRETKDSCETKGTHNLSFKILFALSIATSIDALATGIILPSAIGVETVSLMLLSVCIIGIITFVLCFFGTYIGKKFGCLLASKAEFVGGIVLILIGIKIFIEHMWFS